MIVFSIFSIVGQAILYVIVKLAYMLRLIKKRTYFKFLVWIVKVNGPVSIKVCQVLSSTPEFTKIVDENFVSLITKLQDDCYPKRKRYLDKFKYKSLKPIASGTIGQVYTVYGQDNTEAILKITHNFIDSEIISSIEKLKIAKFLTYYFNENLYNLLCQVNLDDFQNFMLLQTNMNHEYENMKEFSKIFADIDIVQIPKILDYSKDYLLMTKANGLKINQFKKKHPEYTEECVALIYSVLISMVENKKLHGDFHYGNFLFNVYKKQVVITILDFGIVCNLTNEESSNLRLALSYKRKDVERKEYLIAFLESIIYKECDNDNERVPIKTIYGKSLKTLSTSGLLKNIKNNSNFRIPANFLSLFTTLEIIFVLFDDCKKKNPDFNKFVMGYMMDNCFI